MPALCMTESLRYLDNMALYSHLFYSSALCDINNDIGVFLLETHDDMQPLTCG